MESFQDKKLIRMAVNSPDIIIALFLLKTIMIILCYTFFVIDTRKTYLLSPKNSLNYRTMLELITWCNIGEKRRTNIFPSLNFPRIFQRNEKIINNNIHCTRRHLIFSPPITFKLERNCRIPSHKLLYI